MAQCRTLHCDNEPRFRAWIPMLRVLGRRGRPKGINEPWHGDFCAKHLIPCIDVKMMQLQRGERIVIERIRQQP